MNCPNCKAKLTCGCQKRSAPNGKQCCSNCINQCNNAAGLPTVPQVRKAYPKTPYTPHS